MRVEEAVEGRFVVAERVGDLPRGHFFVSKRLVIRDGRGITDSGLRHRSQGRGAKCDGDRDQE